MHDVTDNTCVQSWFNSPMTGALGADIYKATNIIRAFRAVGKVAPESGIPAAVLHGAAGFAILSIAKVCGLHVTLRRALCPTSPSRGLVFHLCTSVGILCADATSLHFTCCCKQC